MPAYRITEPLTICFFGAVFVSLFFSSASRWPAIGAIIWALGFAAYLKLGQQNTISRLERDKQ
jgi:AAT family amino acid transporter